MKIIPAKLNGVFIIEPDIFQDERGTFIKTFHKDTFINAGMESVFEESFFSVSRKNVIRGMHFQIPPKDHEKLIYVTRGSSTDVILDIRKGSPTYGEHVTVEMSDKNYRMVFIPKGCAHGFIAREDDTCMVYLQTTMHSKEHDTGIKFDSFGMDWNVKNPIVSKRDQGFQTLKEFKTPFIYKK